MKRIVSLFAVAAFALSPVADSLAQPRTEKVGPDRKGLARKVENKHDPAGAQFDAVGATSNGSGVLIEWQMKVEKGNIGFRVYRIANGRRIQINNEMILGS